MACRKSILRVTCTALLAGCAGAGCNEQAPAVNRVQPNAIEKAVFAGEWYFLQTVIDTPYSAGYTFVGEQGTLYKIR
ncbi:MAG: hypothetical protein NZ898_17030, partial [Myxococcota bacterium]|nr:hypothetical protein [Myxococcota bacterium]